jgi:hypothetical protein
MAGRKELFPNRLFHFLSHKSLFLDLYDTSNSIQDFNASIIISLPPLCLSVLSQRKNQTNHVSLSRNWNIKTLGQASPLQ